MPMISFLFCFSLRCSNIRWWLEKRWLEMLASWPDKRQVNNNNSRSRRRRRKDLERYISTWEGSYSNERASLINRLSSARIPKESNFDENERTSVVLVRRARIAATERDFLCRRSNCIHSDHRDRIVNRRHSHRHRHVPISVRYSTKDVLILVTSRRKNACHLFSAFALEFLCPGYIGKWVWWLETKNYSIASSRLLWLLRREFLPLLVVNQSVSFYPEDDVIECVIDSSWPVQVRQILSLIRNRREARGGNLFSRYSLASKNRGDWHKQSILERWRRRKALR